MVQNNEERNQLAQTKGLSAVNRRWTCGMFFWFACNLLVSLPGWAGGIAHLQWSDNSIFELMNHTLWHVTIALWLWIAFSAFLGWLRGSRSPSHWRVLNALAIFPPAIYLAWVTTPWTALPLHRLTAQADLGVANKKIANQENSNRLKIFSWNLLLANDRYREILDTIEQADADIVVLLELTPGHIQGLKELRDRYPYSQWLPRTNTRGLAILTRIPNTTFEELDFATTGYPSLAATLPAKGENKRTTKLLAMHTSSPNLDNRFLVRDKQLAAAGKWVQEQDSDLILVGDLNITPWSHAFRSMLRESSLRDSRDYRGFFATWPTGLGIVGIPIDHALVSSNWRVIDRDVGFPSLGSDHQWISVTVEKAPFDKAPFDNAP
jgi:endonuclease/exonuclease/phosphatase (EEP) superfamily protein YafD